MTISTLTEFGFAASKVYALRLERLQESQFDEPFGFGDRSKCRTSTMRIRSRLPLIVLLTVEAYGAII